ncbi:hypothetical protein Tco_0243290 [Tanacetum coccineum]
MFHRPLTLLQIVQLILFNVDSGCTKAHDGQSQAFCGNFCGGNSGYCFALENDQWEVVFGKPFVRKNGLVYDQEEGMVTFEKDNKKITFKMPYKMEAFNHIDFRDVNTDSIPPFVLENNDDHGKVYYSDSLTLVPEYREEESISKEILHLMKLEREAKRNKGEVT